MNLLRASFFGWCVVAGLVAPAERGVTADPASGIAEARALQDREQWAAAESLATQALHALESSADADSVAIADALYLIGVSKWRGAGYADGAGMQAAARALALRERRLAPDDLRIAESHALLARFLQGTDRLDSAAFHVRRMIAIRESSLGAGDTLVADGYDQLALVCRDRRDFHGALDAWNRAIDIRTRAQGRDTPEVARLLGQTGVPWMELDDLERAREVLEESLAIFDRTTNRDYADRWVPLNILSEVERRLGNAARGLDLLQEALRVERLNEGEHARPALTIRYNLCQALADFGDLAGARAVMERLIPELEAQYGPMHPRVMYAQMGVAYWSTKLHDPGPALGMLARLDSMMAARPGPPLRDHSLVQGMRAQAFIEAGRYGEARAMAERAMATFEASRTPVVQQRIDLMKIRQLAEEGEGDTTALAAELDELRKLDAEQGLRNTDAGLDLRYFAARAALETGRAEDAWRFALDAEALSHERLRLNLASLPDRRGLQFARQQSFYLELVLHLAGERPAAAREVAWDRLVRARGLVRAEMEHRRPPLALAADTAVTGSHARWTDAQRRLARWMVTHPGRDSAALAMHEQLRAVAERAEGDYASVLAARGSTLDSAETGLADVRAHLARGQALVALAELRVPAPGRWPGDSAVVIGFVARGGDPEIDTIAFGPSATLREALAPWIERLGTPPGAKGSGRAAEQACRRAGAAVRALTWGLIAPHVAGATDVFLVADGPLLDLPWQALPEGDRYLVEAGPRLHLLNAERVLAAPADASPSHSMLAVGGADFDGRSGGAADDRVLQVRPQPDPCSGGGRARLLPLPSSGAEARDVAGAWRADPQHDAILLTGADATERAFKADASGRAVIHLATHGVVADDTCRAGVPALRGVGGIEWLDAPAAQSASVTQRPAAESPWAARRVWLALAGANRPPGTARDENEGILTAEEVVTLDLDGTDWVVLSACRSGVAEAWWREGTLGMRRAFDLAGVRTVIASQWSVEDESAREWMRALYAARAHGAAGAAAAIEAADRSVLAARRRAGRSTHPFYWAAFVATGE